jgi:chitinase
VSNVDAQVRYWTENKAPASKIVVGIPTFGRAWQLKEESGITGVPPLNTKGPAPEGIQTKQSGLLSWPEVCAKLPNPSNAMLKGDAAPLRRVTDPSKRYGTYAFRVVDENEEHGLWVGYEDPDTAGNKANYVRSKGLGGIAICDLTMDDFRGACTGEKYTILRAAKYRL